MTTKPQSAHKWEFASRLRRNAFGWRSDLPIRRIKEALSEIRQVARKEPVLAAEGAILLLEKLSPALMEVDSSSGALGNAVNRAIETLVPIIAKADVDAKTRQRWLERLWQALQDDEMPYIEWLGDFWGELCVMPALASAWADEFLPVVQRIWSDRESGYGYFKGTSACLSALYVAGRYDELLSLLEKARFKWWLERRWGVRALLAQGKKKDALSYAEASRGLNAPDGQISAMCEDILLSSGLAEEAYRRYAIEANQASTHLATFRAILKKYPHKAPTEILHDLVSSQPGNEGKWFAAAKEAGLYEAAIGLVTRSPADPRTLIRAARDYARTQPAFAIASGKAALHWIGRGHGYEILGVDVLNAYQGIMDAARFADMDEIQVKQDLLQLIEHSTHQQKFLHGILDLHLKA